jgi:hypothetical protein
MTWLKDEQAEALPRHEPTAAREARGQVVPLDSRLSLDRWVRENLPWLLGPYVQLVPQSGGALKPSPVCASTGVVLLRQPSRFNSHRGCRRYRRSRRSVSRGWAPTESSLRRSERTPTE